VTAGGAGSAGRFAERWERRSLVTVVEHVELESRYGMHTEQFSDLMAYRVTEVLLVAAEYDAFVLEEDGQLTELVFEKYRDLDLNLRYTPHFTRVDTSAEALRLLSAKPFDLVITTPRLPDADLPAFCRRVKAEHGDIPVGVLAAHAWELPRLHGLREEAIIDWIFLWLGDVKSLLALIKQVEDRRNVEHDVLKSGVQAIILVEDDVRFCSFYLPHLYEEVTRQTSRLLAEGLNLSHRLLRMRARPKILLAQTFEEAWQLYESYGANLLGIISDISFPHEGRLDPEGGIALAHAVRSRDADLPILLQSTEETGRWQAAEVPASFVHKQSPTLLEDIRRFLLDNFGFGDFVFRLPDGTEVGRAADFRQLLARLGEVPDASVSYHAEHNHFSRWLKARTEFELAAMVKPRRLSEFASITAIRSWLVGALTSYLREIRRHVITDYDVEHFDEFVAFAKIGSGSLGGKGRGLAFMHKLLAQEKLDLPGVETAIPQTTVVSSDVFEEFLDDNRLHPQSLGVDRLRDEEILDAFRRGRFSSEHRAELAKFLQVVTEPIAVRSSSILEDSLYQPFAGVYATVMLPNSHPSLDVRLAQLLEAIKVVYASTYLQSAREYLESTPHRVDEERMAVLLQRLVGSRRGQYFYPTLAGVACSYNFYPFGDVRPQDGVAQIALGLGKSVVEGSEALRFCPTHPQVLPQFSAVADILRNAQRRFFALDMGRDDIIPGLPVDANLVQLETTQAVSDGAANPIASTYLADNDTIVPGVIPGGTPLITFASMLKQHVLPLPTLLERILRAAERGMGVPVEIEFAAEIAPQLASNQSFHVLQVRPMFVERLDRETSIDNDTMASAIVSSERAMGHGRMHTVSDIVVVSADLDRARTREVSSVIDRLNHALRTEGRPYVLIGPGRWGSRDPWLGIPVSWPQVSGARAIVETDFCDLQVEPSQGSHFFHNLTSFGVAFLTVRRDGEGRINWAWLSAQPAVQEEMAGQVRHIRLEKPLQVLVNGATGRGVILADDRSS
jgi:CheY-like chemotaxis protein